MAMEDCRDHINCSSVRKGGRETLEFSRCEFFAKGHGAHNNPTIFILLVIYYNSGVEPNSYIVTGPIIL